jgi:hypothetical protein
MKELEEESQRLRKMYLEEKLKSEIVAEAQSGSYANSSKSSLGGDSPSDSLSQWP